MPFNSLDKTRPVLIIDDSPMYRTAAKGMLQKLGYLGSMLHYAQDAKEAIARCKQENYGMVFFDYNLGDKANGFQLIDELQQCKYLAADCVNIIVTGDATADVVRGFMELEPDGYLLKPLNYSTLKERLPGFMRKKHILSELLIAYEKEQYKKVVTLADESFYTEDDIIVKAQYYKARSLMKLGAYDDARNVLINLKGSSETGRSILALAEISLKQRQYQQGLFLLKPLKKDAFLAAAAANLSAELHIAQIQFKEAIQEIDTAIKISPKMIERYWLKTYLYMATFNLPQAVNVIRTMILESKHSYRACVTMYQLGAQIILDQAQFSTQDNRDVLLQSLDKWIELWRANFPKATYKPLELLIVTRSHLLKGSLSKANQSMDEYKQVCAAIENYQPPLLEQIELSRAFLLFGKNDDYTAITEKINIQLKQEPFTSEDKTILAYLSQWRNRSQRMHESANKLKQEAITFIAARSFEKASIVLAKAMESHLTDPEIPKLLFGVLTRAWPANMGKKEVVSLAIRCKEQIRETDYYRSPDFQAQSKVLAQQLDYKDLSV